MKAMIFAALLGCTLVGLPVAAKADCSSEQSELMGKIQSAMNTMQSGGMCQGSRQYQRLLYEASALYRRCRSLDPSGQNARETESAAQQTQATINSVCR